MARVFDPPYPFHVAVREHIRQVVAAGLTAAAFAGGCAAFGATDGDNATPTDLDGGRPVAAADATDALSSVGDVVVQCDAGLAGRGAVILPRDGEACPSGTTEQTLKTAPQLMPGACRCGACQPATEPSCAGNGLVWQWGSSSQCLDNGLSFDIPANNACVVMYPNAAQKIAAFNRWGRSPTPGTCKSEPVADPLKVATTPIRQCVPKSNTELCDAIAKRERLCIPADSNDQAACSGAFSVAMSVGDEVRVVCEPCGCSRTAKDCTVEYFANENCTGSQLKLTADGVCGPTNQPTITAMKVYPTTPSCIPILKGASASLTNLRVLCCMP
jgi:hypothetical protein